MGRDTTDFELEHCEDCDGSCTPEEPSCLVSDHDWGETESKSVGGTTFSHHDRCKICGVHRTVTRHGAQRDPGECDSVEYEQEPYPCTCDCGCDHDATVTDEHGTLLCDACARSLFSEDGGFLGCARSGLGKTCHECDETIDWGCIQRDGQYGSNYRTGACSCGSRAWVDEERGTWGNYAYTPAPKVRAADMDVARWIIPPVCGGQIVEVSYGSDGATLYRRVIDRSLGASAERRADFFRADAGTCGCEDECDCFDPVNSDPVDRFTWEEIRVV